MATGDQNDFVSRLRSVLPQGWFPLSSPDVPAQSLGGGTLQVGGISITDQTSGPILTTLEIAAVAGYSNAPVLNSVLSGFGNGLAWAYSLIEYALKQIGIVTSTGIWVDLHAQDYFGTGLLRKTQEPDAAYIARIEAGLFPAANTRAALIAKLTALTGRVPAVFEPTMPSDTGALNYGSTGLNVSGGLGSLALPYQAFVTAYRLTSQGVPLLPGLNGNTSSPHYAPGGFGSGLIALSSLAQAASGVSDTDIYATVAATEPAGSIVWTKISS